jgi:outer membrane protein assembly factor BamB
VPRGLVYAAQFDILVSLGDSGFVAGLAASNGSALWTYSVPAAPACSSGPVLGGAGGASLALIGCDDKIVRAISTVRGTQTWASAALAGTVRTAGIVDPFGSSTVAATDGSGL